MPAGQNGERTPLISHTPNGGANTTSWHDEDISPWVKYPKHISYITWLTLSSNYVNVLLVFVPLGMIAGGLGWSPTTVFVLNFLAICPLASLLSFATEELSVKLGETVGGLLNATFGNAVELIVSLECELSLMTQANKCASRSASLRFSRARSVLCRRVCWVVFSRICY